MSDTKTILVMTASFPRWDGDADGVFVMENIKRLTRWHRIVVLAPHYPGSPRAEIMHGVQIYRFRYCFPEKIQQLCYGPGILPNLLQHKWLFALLPLFVLSFFISAIRIHYRERASMIHAQWLFPAGFIAALVRIPTRVPILLTAYGSDLWLLRGKVWEWLKEKIIRGSKNVVVVDQTMVHSLSQQYGLSPGIITYIPNGVDSHLFAPGQDQSGNGNAFGQPNILYVGMLNEKKGLRYLFEAIDALRPDFPKILLTLVGEGHEKAYLEKLSVNLSISEHIRYIGRVRNADLPPYYQKADLFVLPSLGEGLPVCVLEAMSCGCPVVATSVGGIPSLVEDGVTGILVKPADSLDLTRGIRQVLEKESLRQLCSQRARTKIVQNYDWEIVVGQYVRIYQHILDHVFVS